MIPEKINIQDYILENQTNELLEPFFSEKLERANELLKKRGAPIIDENGNMIGLIFPPKNEEAPIRNYNLEPKESTLVQEELILEKIAIVKVAKNSIGDSQKNLKAKTKTTSQLKEKNQNKKNKK